MKNKLMLVIILAGLSTAVYRFLPMEMQHQINAQLNNVAQIKSVIPTATANPSQKKYVLDIPDTTSSAHSDEGSVDLVNAYMRHQSGVQVRDQGEVVKILFDDTQGAKHQKFIVRSQAGFTILIAHNIDLARRISSLAVGDSVSFYGEYEWNGQGGVVHWTHRDPRGHHTAGWIKHKGVTYQ